MRQIVPEQIWEEIVRNYGGEAVTDLNLYNEIFQKHYIQAFHEFCIQQKFELFSESDQKEKFDVSVYIKLQILRREALNLFILQKPHIVMHEERCFSITFLSDIEIEINEISIFELAAFVNEILANQSFLSRIKKWFRKQFLLRKLNFLSKNLNSHSCRQEKTVSES